MELASHMVPMDHALISDRLQPDILLLLALETSHAALVIILIISKHTFHHLKLEITIFVIDQMDLIPFGLEKAARMIIHTAHFITLHTSVYSSLQQLQTGLSYVSVMINIKMMRTYRCCLLKFMYSHSS